MDRLLMRNQENSGEVVISWYVSSSVDMQKKITDWYGFGWRNMAGIVHCLFDLLVGEL